MKYLHNCIHGISLLLLLTSSCNRMISISSAMVPTNTIQVISTKPIKTPISTPSITQSLIQTIAPTYTTTSTPSKYYTVIYQNENAIIKMRVDEYGNTYASEEILRFKGFLVGEDVSSDGKEIVYSYIESKDMGIGKSNDSIIEVYNLDTKKEYVLRSKNYRSFYPKWSPNKEYISYTYLDKYRSFIRIDPTKKCSGDNCFTRYFRYFGSTNDIVNYANTIWSYDSKYVIFLRHKLNTNSEDPTFGGSDLCVGNMTTLHIQCPLKNIKVDLSSLLLSIDDKYLFFQSTMQNTPQSLHGIFVFYFTEYIETGEIKLVKISSTDASYYSVAIAKDNSYLYFVKENAEDKVLYRSKITVSSPEEWLNNPQIIYRNSTLDTRLYTISQDGSVISWFFHSFDGGLCFLAISSNETNTTEHCINGASTSAQWLPE